MIPARPSGLSSEVPLSDPALVRAAAAGDSDALDVLVGAWGPTVLRWCARLGGGRLDPEDAAHDVFERVFRKLPGLRAPEAFPSWLFQTTRGVVSQHRRRAWLRRWIGAPSEDLPDPRAVDPAAADVHAALDTLGADLREVVVLHDVEGRVDREVAALTGLPLGTVKSRLRRGRAALARALGEPAPAPALAAGEEGA